VRERKSLRLSLAIAWANLFFLGIFLLPEALRCEPLGNWEWKNLPEEDSLRVAYGGGMFLALGGSGAIYISVDGTAWTPQSSGTDRPLHDAVFSGDMFVAVGEGGTLITSPNGVDWTARLSGTVRTLRGVAYGGGVFAAVGDSGVILTSPDGVTWTPRDSGIHQMLNKVSFGGETFAAVGENGTILTSPDGAAWTRRDSGTVLHLDGVAHGKNTFVAVGQAILTSPDGFTWSRRYLKTNHRLLGVAYGDGAFTAVADDGTILTSPDGSDWTQKSPGTGLALLAVARGEKNFMAAGEKGLLALSESSSGPRLVLSFTTFDFGTVPVGGSSAANLALTNSGSGNLVIGRLTITGINVFDFITQNDLCSGKTLSPSQNCTVQVVFFPRTTGSKSAALSVSSNDPVNPTQTVSLTGDSIAHSGDHDSTESFCFISTSVQDSWLEPWVDLLRKFRDTFLLRSDLGRSFVDSYYQNSPAMARFIARHEVLRTGVRLGLVPLVAVSYMALYTSPAEKILVFMFVTGGIGCLGTRRSRRFLGSWISSGAGITKRRA
jgi:Abnormal spindle-like microcephaly-assoc'd, ASPM-SPD-2-Hydin